MLPNRGKSGSDKVRKKHPRSRIEMSTTATTPVLLSVHQNVQNNIRSALLPDPMTEMSAIRTNADAQEFYQVNLAKPGSEPS